MSHENIIEAFWDRKSDSVLGRTTMNEKICMDFVTNGGIELCRPYLAGFASN